MTDRPKHWCWECMYFPLKERYGLPPTENYASACLKGIRHPAHALTEVCSYGTKDHQRVAQTIPESVPKVGLPTVPEITSGIDEMDHQRVARKIPKSVPKVYRLTVSETTSDIDEKNLAIFMTCLENTTDRGLIKLKAAKVKLEDLVPLEKSGHVQFRVYDGVTRPFIPKVSRMRKMYLTERGSQ